MYNVETAMMQVRVLQQTLEEDKRHDSCYKIDHFHFFLIKMDEEESSNARVDCNGAL